MKPLTAEWVERGERSMAAIALWSEQSDRARFATHIATYAHLAAEDYLKAWHIEQGILPRKPGNLRRLLRQCKGETDSWRGELEAMDWLSGFEDASSDIEITASTADAERAIVIANRIRTQIRERLGLD